jgi:hypothetical protein
VGGMCVVDMGGESSSRKRGWKFLPIIGYGEYK